MSESDSYCSSDSVSSSPAAQGTESDSNSSELPDHFQPYQGEPLATSDEGSDSDVGDDAMDDGVVTPADLRARFEGEISVETWCQCTKCQVGCLVSAREFRCCREVYNMLHKLTFDGSIESFPCVTLHTDFEALTNKTVLLQVGPLLKDRQGRSYRQRSGISENEYLRAVAYRWIIRWFYGYLGWDNTKALPACIYHHFRTKFSSHHTSGYANTQERS